MCSLSPSTDKTKAFNIRSTPEFANRSDSIFSGLNELEEKHDKWNSETPVSLDLQKPDPAASEILYCKTPIFKRPRLPLSLKRKRNDVVPDYVMNPHKWKKYSLIDTPAVTEESNKAAALQFLQDLKKEREETAAAVTGMEGMTFRKPSPQKVCVTEEEQQESEISVQSPSFSCTSVHKMPELVVGEKKTKVVKPVLSCVNVGTVVKLDHLEENLDD